MADEHSTNRSRIRRKIFSPELIESVLRDYQAGLSATAAAELHDLYPYDVTKILRQNGIAVRREWIRLWQFAFHFSFTLASSLEQK